MIKKISILLVLAAVSGCCSTPSSTPMGYGTAAREIPPRGLFCPAPGGWQLKDAATNTWECAARPIPKSESIGYNNPGVMYQGAPVMAAPFPGNPTVGLTFVFGQDGRWHQR